MCAAAPARSCVRGWMYGSLHPQKDLQLVKGDVITAPTKTKTQQKQHDIQDKL